MNTSDIAIFPLQTVLVPGAFLPLQIFEPRYLELVRDCVKYDQGFGVCLIMEAGDPGSAAQHVRIGTLARIRDWNTLPNGLLGVTTQGHERFSIESTRMRDNGLMMATVRWFPKEGSVQIPVEKMLLSEIVGRFMDKLSANYPGYEPAWLEDADWVGFRLTELLPLKNLERQGLLELENPLERLDQLLRLLPRFQ